jgi:prevent-host-death family protein
MIVEVEVAQEALSELIERACEGEEIVIVRDSRPLVRIVPIAPSPARRVFGSMRGKLTVPPEFFEPLPEEDLDAWEPRG